MWDKTFAVNLMGSYNLVRAAGPHVAHRDGYFLLTASLAAAMHLPLMSAYSASKAAVESLGDSLRIELRPSGARVGVAYYSELDTDMTSRGFATEAAKRTPLGSGRLPVAPVGPAIDALERAIRRRSRRIVSPPVGRRRSCPSGCSPSGWWRWEPGSACGRRSRSPAGSVPISRRRSPRGPGRGGRSHRSARQLPGEPRPGAVPVPVPAGVRAPMPAVRRVLRRGRLGREHRQQQP